MNSVLLFYHILPHGARGKIISLHFIFNAKENHAPEIATSFAFATCYNMFGQASRDE
jgi:hypothetical protein